MLLRDRILFASDRMKAQAERVLIAQRKLKERLSHEGASRIRLIALPYPLSHLKQNFARLPVTVPKKHPTSMRSQLRPTRSLFSAPGKHPL